MALAAPEGASVHPLFAEVQPPPSVPSYDERFKVPRAKQIIGEILRTKLGSAAYQADNASAWAREISDDIKRKFKGEPWAQRYKIVVQVIIGEQRGEGCNIAARCFWDQQADGWAQEAFSNESLFCAAAAFGCYLY